MTMKIARTVDSSNIAMELIRNEVKLMLIVHTCRPDSPGNSA